MTAAELREKIRLLIPTVVGNKKQAEEAAVEYDELTKFPELKSVIVDLLTHEFDSFLASIDWVAPKPTTFRINLKNDQDFYLIYSRTSWIAQIEGKKYYLLNLPEEERACEAIARILRYGVKVDAETDGGGTESGGAGEDVDIEVDDNVDIDV
jgi:hypothetical protein|tara:strand:+ start:50 stop:508 length:459 start_codon:yes stop_codon:yes gene_type:complete